MSAAAMMKRIAAASPRLKARVAGVLYFFSLLAAANAFFVSLARRLNFVAYLATEVPCTIAVTLLLYDIFKPVNRGLSLLAAFFSLVGLTFEALRLQPQGVDFAVVFNGFYCLLIGYLIFRSAFLPRILGALIGFAGLGWLTSLSPQLARTLSPYNLAFELLGKALVMLWLLVIGVNVQRWNMQAGAAGERQ